MSEDFARVFNILLFCAFLFFSPQAHNCFFAPSLKINGQLNVKIVCEVSEESAITADW